MTCEQEQRAIIDHQIWMAGFEAAKRGEPGADIRDIPGLDIEMPHRMVSQGYASHWLQGWRDYHDAQRRAAARDGERL